MDFFLLLQERKNVVRIEKICIDLDNTFCCGQTFRWKRQEDGSWLAIDMTNAETQKIIERVYLAFYDGETLLMECMIESDAPHLTPPDVTVPEDKVFAGWVIQEDDGNGKITLTVVFHPTENGTIHLPVGNRLEHMTLYAHFAEATE